MASDQHLKILNHAVDTVSAGAILGVIAGALPPIAAFVAVLWYIIQIWESKTVQRHVRARNIRIIRQVRLRRQKEVPNPPDFPKGPNV